MPMMRRCCVCFRFRSERRLSETRVDQPAGGRHEFLSYQFWRLAQSDNVSSSIGMRSRIASTLTSKGRVGDALLWR